MYSVPFFFSHKQAPAGVRHGMGIYARAYRRHLLQGALLLVLLWITTTTQSHAQYFGKNKIGYRKIDFKTTTSPNLQLYYHSSDSVAKKMIMAAERWYRAHKEILNDSIEDKNPIVLYNNHADFQQSTLFNDNIDPGTGGVTESIRNRIVMPYTHLRRETSHVLGHEMVHAFQFNMIKNTDSLSASNWGQVPLWVIEGMAEFLSLGRNDPHTAMWLRDAVVEEYFPTIQALSTPEYFPYRYGHAFWAFVSGLWGDEIVRKLFINMGRYGVEHALLVTLGYDSERLSRMWRETTRRYYERFLQNKQHQIGEIVYGDAETLVISPAVSPDGRYVAFYTQLSPISPLELVLVDAANKRLTRKISSLSRAYHVDFLNPLESAPTWSPDSKQLATVTYSKGRSAILIINARTGSLIEKISFPKVGSILYPSWSPKGDQIAFSGMKDGQSDIYAYHLTDKTLRAITSDPYSDIQPNWSEDGTQLVFATDRLSDGREKAEGVLNLAVVNLKDNSVESLGFFPEADNLNPQFIPDGGILFVSDRDGFRNLYKYDQRIKQVYAMTNLATGISGITRYSQAITFSPGQNTIYYSLYQRGSYRIARAGLQDFLYIPVDNTLADKAAGILPPSIPLKPERVTPRLHAFNSLETTPKDSIHNIRYRPLFRLEGIGSGGIGIGVTTGLGPTFGGSIALKFSDILGNNDIYVASSINGEIFDIGVATAYVNKKHRIDWGVELSHVPTPAHVRNVSSSIEEIDGIRANVRRINTDTRRTFNETLSVFGHLPFSTFWRLQANIGAVFQSFRIDRYSNIYVLDNGFYRFYRRERKRQPAPKPLLQFFGGMALVADKARFALVGPIHGHRYHVGSTQYGGSINFNSITVDGRFYRYWRPIGIAIRAYHTGRYGRGGEDSRIFPLSVAFPTLVRGYNFAGVYRDIGNALLTNNAEGRFAVNDYVGSKILVGNFEVRIPFTGPKKVGLIRSNIFLTEFALFFDWGLAFASKDYNRRLFGITEDYTQAPIYSAGIALRINLFGFFVIEPFYAFPFKREYQTRRTGAGTFGLNISPAW